MKSVKCLIIEGTIQLVDSIDASVPGHVQCTINTYKFTENKTGYTLTFKVNSNSEKFNFFKENIGGKIGLVFKNKILIDCFVFEAPKEVYNLTGTLVIAESDHGVNSEYYTLNLSEKKLGHENYVPGIEVKNNTEYANLFKKYVNTGKVVSITFKNSTHQIVNFSEIR